MNLLKEYLIERPLSVTITSLFVLFITVWNGIRTAIAIADWDVLWRFNANPVYIFASGLVWLVAGLVLLILISKGEPLSLQTGLILSVVYMGWYWLDRLVIQVSPTGNAPFSAVASGILFVIFNAILFMPSSRAFFLRRQDE